MLWLEIDKHTGVPLIRQIYNQIRTKILHGDLKAGEQLPSTRELASFLHVSRNVILEAFQMLLAEGYVFSKPHIGTFVAEGATLAETKTPLSFLDNAGELSAEEVSGIIDFRSGIPALDLLPKKKWTQIKNQVYLDAPDCIFGYGSAEGRPELRGSICQYLQRTRGVMCHPDQMLITSGSIQSFSLISKMLLKHNAPYIIEDPLHIEIKKVFLTDSLAYHAVSVDSYGIQTALLPSEINPKLIFITPSHQYPLGGHLPIQRRIELIQYARTKGCYIVEDDYDSEFRYTGAPISSLQGLDPDVVIYVGTFSKVMFPSVRIGYVILPWPLVKDFREYKRRTDYFTNVPDQIAMARFIDTMVLERHIRTMKKVYQKRRNCLIQSLLREFRDEVKILGESTGLHLIAEFQSVDFSEELVRFLHKVGIGISPVWVHSFDSSFPRNQIILGYSHLSEDVIKNGVAKLKTCLENGG